jgi:peptidoglycan/LPS O-acetylase OafA/YrhL
MQEKQHLDALTALRFFAAALIVIGHADPVFGPFSLVKTAPFNQGVSFFFVLSGFILTWNYPSLAGWEERRKFWVARVARIWPLHLVTCFLWIGIILNFDRATHFPGAEGLIKLFANLILVQAWVPSHNWALSFNGVSWSISTELFFYAMFPVLVTLWQKRWHQIVLIQVLIICSVLVVATALAIPSEATYPAIALPVLLYFTPIVRIFEFTMGIALAFLVRKIMRSNLVLSSSKWLALELAALTIVVLAMLTASNLTGIRQTLGEPATYHLTASGLWLFWSILIGVFALSGGPLTRLLSIRPFVFLGEISFSLYLCHALIIHYLMNYKEQLLPFGLMGYGAFWMWCLILSSVLFMGIETPFRKFILLIASSKRAVYALISSYRGKEIAALCVLACMVLAMLFLRPSTIVKLEHPAIANFLASSPDHINMPSGVVFDGRYEVLGLRTLVSVNEAIEVQVLMRTRIALRAKDTLALHAINSKGEMIGNYDLRLDYGRLDIPEQTYWIQKFKVPKTKILESTSLGLAMYTTPVKLFVAEGGNRDWGGTRLILPITNQLK